MDKNDKDDDLDIEGSYMEAETHAVLVFRGSGDIADTVSVSLFSSPVYRDNFCDFLNKLKLAKNSFIYAAHVQKMVEYATTKPMLTRFDEIFDYCGFINEFHGTKITRDTLAQFSAATLLTAFKGLDKSSRELIMQLLPIKTADEINDMINLFDKKDNHGVDVFTLSQIANARQKIVNAISRNAQKCLDGMLTGHEILKD